MESKPCDIVHEIAAAVAALHMVGAGMTPKEIREQFDDIVAEYGEAGSPTAFACARAVLAAIRADGCRVVKDDLVGEGFHAGFRKASDCAQAHQIYRLIEQMPDDQWSAVIEFVLDGASVG